MGDRSLTENALTELLSAVRDVSADSAVPAWPATLQREALATVGDARKTLDEMGRLADADDHSQHHEYVEGLDRLLARLRILEAKILEGLEQEHGRGKPDSPGFRQYMAEYMVSFPTANLDRVRALISPVVQLRALLASPAGALAAHRVFVLAGAAGSGKTHGICDAAESRLQNGLLTCVTFGHEFQGGPDPWTRLLESLSLPVSLGMNGLLDALDAAGGASGYPLILCIDAINETRPPSYWRDRLASIVVAASRRRNIRLCVSCRSSFLPFCLPDGHDLLVAEHGGFVGVEREACQSFFQHYGLVPPIAPVLQPEFSNPLYLKLVCQTLQARGLRQLPAGWHGLAPTIAAFLEMKEQHFAADHSVSTSARIVAGSLMAIVRAMAEAGLAGLPWSQAQLAVLAAKPGANASEILNWLVRADLLIEDAPRHSSLDAEGEVRPAFERLGDFLVAGELLDRAERVDLQTAAKPGGLLHTLLKDDDSVARNAGVLNALAVLVPERNRGLELPDLFVGQSVYGVLLRSAIHTLQFRDPATLTDATRECIREGLKLGDFSAETFDALVAMSWQPSPIDATWLDRVLRWAPLAKRDAFWCGYLHTHFEPTSVVRRLIEASFELPLNQLDEAVADRWSTTLLWFTAAADRRVKDHATRAATKVMAAVPSVIAPVLSRLIDCDDDEVRERSLLVAYGALVLSRDRDAVRETVDVVREAAQMEESAFDNALIRDDVRCIVELSRELDVLADHEDTAWATRSIDGEWPLSLPSPEDTKRWGEMLFKPNEFSSDFFKYSMNCLAPWMHEISKEKMAEWILKRVAHDFRYEGSGAERFDEFMVGKFGSGRGKSAWAERIGKKYQWIAMYQLASRLSDHVKRKRDEWTPAPLRPPLLLLEERKIDPTLWRRNDGEESDAAWWISGSADLDREDRLSDEEWVARRDDVPSLKQLLSTAPRDGRTWRVLLSFLNWSRREKGASVSDEYRQVWIHVRSYLVPKKDLSIAYASLRERNFFGGWMPEGANWLYGFAGEYPWATSFNTDPDHWHGRGGSGRDLPVPFRPTANQLTVEFEYDATKAPNYFLCLPAREFFARKDLWWNGTDGFRRVDGTTVFRDPSITEPGPPTLLADADDLQRRLKRSGECMIWTLLGEKWILGGMHHEQRPFRVFSQVASLDGEGALKIGTLRFFERHDDSASPRTVKKSRNVKQPASERRSQARGKRKASGPGHQRKDRPRRKTARTRSRR